nr:unnamed protein product [Callosobruchus analis]
MTFFRLMKKKVGMKLMLYSTAMSSHSSTSIFSMTTLVNSLASSANTGSIVLQGAHQVAWKSNTTNLSPASSSLDSRSPLSFTDIIVSR